MTTLIPERCKYCGARLINKGQVIGEYECGTKSYRTEGALGLRIDWAQSLECEGVQYMNLDNAKKIVDDACITYSQGLAYRRLLYEIHNLTELVRN